MHKQMILRLGALVFGLVVFAPNSASAGVQCSNENGSCTLETDVDQIECTCALGDVFGGTGGNEWSGLGEAELVDACLSYLADCPTLGGTGDGTGEGDTNATTTGSEGCDSAGEDSGGDSLGDGTGGTESGGESTYGDGTGGTESGGTDEGESIGDGTGGTESGGEGSDDEAACHCAVIDDPGFSVAALFGLFGLVGFRRANRGRASRA